ncbi:MAG: dehypoxanthine futalosine cyclase [Actinobacteria bacterium]|nr:dehypoxanthine futalosine cyclase [Actinomycetota bacterium]
MDQQLLLHEVLEGRRLTEQETILLLKEGDLLAIGSAADIVRERLFADTVTFIIDRNINYTNICTSKCRFCAFYRDKDDSEAYLLSKEEVFSKIEETLALGGTQIMMQGGLHPELKIDYYEDLLRSIKEHYPIVIHSFGAPEVAYIASISDISIDEVLKRLKDAGLDSLPGAGAEILVDHYREAVSPNKVSADRWLDVMERAHYLGIESTSTMMMGGPESVEDRIEHMSKIRRLQDRTGGFRAFIAWTYQPGHTELGGETVSSREYLKTLAVARLFFDNIKHIQGSWVTQGKDIGQLSLSFGADDLGSIMIEENVVRATGVTYKMSKDEMVRLIEATGKRAARRNTTYEIIERFEV